MYVGSFPFSSEDPGLSFVFGIANADVTPDKLESEVTKSLKKMQTELYK